MRPSGPFTLIKDHLAGGASRLPALLLPQILPVFSVVAPCHPGAALRDLVLVQRGRATRAVLRAFQILAAFLCVLALPRTVAAEWHITPLIGFTFAGKTTLLDPQVATDKRHVDFGGAITLLGGGVIGAETIIVFTPDFFQTDRTPLETDVGRVEFSSSRTIAVMGNVVLTLPRRLTEYSLRPYVSGGFGILRASRTEAVAEVLPLRLNLAGFNIGGGAVGFFSQHTGVRFDLRYYSTVHGTDHGPVAIGDVHLRYMTASVGLVIRR